MEQMVKILVCICLDFALYMLGSGSAGWDKDDTIYFKGYAMGAMAVTANLIVMNCF